MAFRWAQILCVGGEGRHAKSHTQKSLDKSNRPITIRVVSQVETTAEFDDWPQSLPDALTRVRLGRRLDKATQPRDIAQARELARLFKE